MWGGKCCYLLAALQTSMHSPIYPLCSLTNPNLFLSFPSSYWLNCHSHRFPVVTGVAIGVTGEPLVSYLPHPVAIGEISECLHNKIAALPATL
jgi:hypothetical protein